MVAREINREEAVALRAYFDGRLDELLRLTRILVETESPSGDLEGRRAVVALLEEAARGLEVVTEVERIERPGYGEHLRVRTFGDGKRGGGTILMAAHTDPLPSRGPVPSRPWRVEGGRIHAPGIFDMK